MAHSKHLVPADVPSDLPAPREITEQQVKDLLEQGRLLRSEVRKQLALMAPDGQQLRQRLG